MTKTKLAVITGASRGLGAEIAKLFQTHGWYVIGTGRSERPPGLPEEIDYHQFDASDAVQCETFWKSLARDHVTSEVCLINNAGGYVSGSLLTTSTDDYEQQMRSCYFSSVYMTRGLAAATSNARIINVISSSALKAHKNNSAYGAAKSAQMHFFQSIQEEFKPQNYQITNLYPYNIASHGPDEYAINASDLATYIYDLASAKSSYYLRDVTIFPSKA